MLLGFIVVAPEGRTQSTMSFVAAADSYGDQVYKFDGYVAPDGTVKNGGLGCSGYAVAVLYRMQNGTNWKAVYKADWDKSKKPHQWYGDKIAGHFCLGPATVVKWLDVSNPTKVKSLITSNALKSNGLYFFNVRASTNGHVGFVRVKADGKLIQSHYSGIGNYNGLATENFDNWRKLSIYKNEDVSLYKVSE